MHELQWWVVILFMLVAIDRITHLFGKFSRWADARGNGKGAPLTVGKLREALGLLPSGDKTFLDIAQETHRERFLGIVQALNKLGADNERMLQKHDLILGELRELVAVMKDRTQHAR